MACLSFGAVAAASFSALLVAWVSSARTLARITHQTCSGLQWHSANAEIAAFAPTSGLHNTKKWRGSKQKLCCMEVTH